MYLYFYTQVVHAAEEGLVQHLSLLTFLSNGQKNC